MLKGNCVAIPKKDFKKYLFKNYSVDETIQMYENSVLSQPVIPAPFPDPEDDQQEEQTQHSPEFEVHVKNIAFNASEDDLRGFF